MFMHVCPCAATGFDTPIVKTTCGFVKHLLQVEKDCNFSFLLDYLATFTGNLPTQAEVEARAPK